MGYVTESKRKLYLLFGFIGMFMCGIGDILFMSIIQRYMRKAQTLCLML